MAKKKQCVKSTVQKTNLLIKIIFTFTTETVTNFDTKKIFFFLRDKSSKKIRVNVKYLD